jgi:outer membrane beta-barrel protein
MRSVNTSMKRLTVGAVLAFAFLHGNAFAQTSPDPAQQKPKPKETAEKADGKVDISDLENKYWAPKDTDFSVVQNRTYTKEKRFFFSAQYGIPASDNYNSGAFYGFTGNYFLTERQGLQLQYIHADLHPNSAISDFSSFGGTGVYPNHGQMTNYYSVGYNFVPFYSKMSLMGKKIIYFDMAITPTLGSTQYEQLEKAGNATQNAFTYGVDITQYFFFTNYMALRVDWKNQWYTQKVVYYETTGAIPAGSPATDRGIHDSLLMFGLTFFY